MQIHRNLFTAEPGLNGNPSKVENIYDPIAEKLVKTESLSKRRKKKKFSVL